jgi:DNA polymerase-1
MNSLLLVDGNALVHRAYHALPFFKTHEGINTNAVYGFATMLLKTTEDFKPSHVAVCFDRPEPTFRKKLLKSYQAQRPKMEDELSGQFPFIKDLLGSANIPVFEKAGFEADDLIGTIAQKAEREGFRVMILTGDRDIIQLVTKNIVVISPIKGLTEIMLYDEKSAAKKFGLPPSKISELKGLMGDASDNYKGVPGIGPKTAVNLLTQFGSVEAIYKNIDQVASDKVKNLLITHKEDALLSKKLATIMCDVAIDIDLASCKYEAYNVKLKDFFAKMQFNSLLRRYFDVKKEPEKKKNEKEKDQLGLF